MEFKLKELDFRFADEEDSLDISILVNRSLQHEIEGSESFRNSQNRITIEQIEADCNSSSTRWIILETPRPEELLVAAGRVSMIKKDNQCRAIVDIFGTVDSESIRNILLYRLESVCRSQGWYILTFEVPSWSETFQNWLNSHGYEDLGGRIWPESQQDILLKPTMILEFQKNLLLSEGTQQKKETTNLINDKSSHNNNNNNIDTSDYHHQNEGDEGLDLLDNFQIDNIVIDSGIDIGNGNGNDNDPMKGLITNLFRALHSENEKHPIQPLQKNEDENT